MINIFYKKNNNKKLFKSLEKNMDVEQLQNYVPLYSNFFDLNENNFNLINLDNKYSLTNIVEKEDELSYKIEAFNEKNEPFRKHCFLKLVHC